MEERSFHPLDYVSVLRRRKWWFVTPVLAALVVGALLAVPVGQLEASRTLGLSELQTLRLIRGPRLNRCGGRGLAGSEFRGVDRVHHAFDRGISRSTISWLSVRTASSGWCAARSMPSALT